MIADTETVILPEIRKLSNKPRWPFEPEAQMELARVAKKYGRDLSHVREVLRNISESWDHCPDGRELREALTSQAGALPAFHGPTKCPLEMCDGSGWVQVWALQTRAQAPGGASFVEKQWLTPDQAKALRGKIDHAKQEIYEGVKRCNCKAQAGSAA